MNVKFSTVGKEISWDYGGKRLNRTSIEKNCFN